MKEPTFPSPDECKRHFKAQEASVFRDPSKRDLGVSIVNTPAEAKAILQAELAGEPVTLPKLRNTAVDLVDPTARVQGQIRAIYKGKVSKEQFEGQIESPRDMLLYEIAFGDQTSNQKAKNLVALAKLLHEEQKLQEEILHRNRQLEQKRTDQLLRATRMADEMRAKKAKRGAE